MLDSLPVTFLISTALGFLAGIGVGGGSLLILWLTLVLGMEQTDARIINLCFFLPAAVISTLYRGKDGVLDIKKLLPGTIAGCISAGIISGLNQYISSDVLRKGFGILLLITGTRELFYKSKNIYPRERNAK